MKISGFFLNVFKFGCIVVTGCMIGYWAYKFHKNSDLTLIEYKLMVDLEDSFYPEITICMASPFIKNDLIDITDEPFFTSQYESYLQGYGSDENYKRYEKVGYNQVTPNLFDYFSGLLINWKPGKNYSGIPCYDVNDCPYFIFKNNYDGFSNQNTSFQKCFGIEAKKSYVKDIKSVIVFFKPELKAILKQISLMFVGFNFPNQLLREPGAVQNIWHDSDHEPRAELFHITSLDIIRRRNKHEYKCMEDWRNFDNLVLKRYMELKDCRVPYIRRNVDIPVCNTQEKMQNARYNGWTFLQKNSFPDPCKEVPFIEFKHHIAQLDHEAFDYQLRPKHEAFDYQLHLIYPSKARVITQSQAVDVHALIGNIGGYIGLFLGKFNI